MVKVIMNQKKIKTIIMIKNNLKKIKVVQIYLMEKIKIIYLSNLKYSFIIPIIFEKMGTKISTNNDPLISYAFYMFIISLIVLTCFINIFGYFISLYLINRYEHVVNKYPKLSKLVNYYEKTSLIFIIIEAIFCVLFLIFIVLANLFII